MSNPNAELESSQWQWTLKDLLIWTAYAAALCAAIVFFGLDGSPFLAYFLFFSLLMTASLAFSIARVVPAIGVSAFFGLAFFSIPLLANCVMHAAFVLWEKLRNKPVSKKAAVHFSLICLFVSIGWVVASGLGSYRDLMVLRERFPRQYHTQRLNYERHHADVLKMQGEHVQPRLTDRWKDFELTLITDLGTWPEARNQYLRQIHDPKAESFVKSQGFGDRRMAYSIYPRGGILPDLANVPFQFADKNRPRTFDEGNYWITPRWRANQEPLDFHFTGLLDFLNTTTFGLMVEPRVTIGFEPHAFHFSAEPIKYKNATLPLSELQLVSLQRFDEPRIYVLDHLPRMDQLRVDNVLTRDLTDFETKSLEKIQDGNEDVVFEFTEHKLLMLGSIRAVQSCLGCHAAIRGELLGAFSYQFDQIQEVNPK